MSSKAPTAKVRKGSPLKENVTRGEMYNNNVYIWIVVTVIVVFIILFVLSPSFVVDEIDELNVTNNRKLMLWTLVFSIILWLIIFFAVYYSSRD